MVFVNEDFEVDESFENFIAPTLSPDSPRPSTPPPVQVPSTPPQVPPRPSTPPHGFCPPRKRPEEIQMDFKTFGPPEEIQREFVEMLNNASLMDSEDLAWEDDLAWDLAWEDDLTLDDFDTAEFDLNAELELLPILDPLENRFFGLINLLINCLRFIITL